MEKEDKVLGKTIRGIVYEDSGDENRIIFTFDDGTSAIIETDASNIIYSLFIK